MMDNAKSEYGKNRNPLSQLLLRLRGEVMFKFVVVGAWNPIDCRCSTVGRGRTAWNGSSDGSQRQEAIKFPTPQPTVCHIFRLETPARFKSFDSITARL